MNDDWWGGRLASAIEALNDRIGRLAAWLVVLMVGVIVYDVAMRYLFHEGSVALQELEWHLFALVFLLGAAYTLRHDGHVRVDIVYQSRLLGERGRAWIDIVGVVCLLVPFCLLVIVSSLPFVANAFALGEGSPDPGGLPARYLLKAVIPLAFVLLLLQGGAMLLRRVEVLRRRGGEGRS